MSFRSRMSLAAWLFIAALAVTSGKSVRRSTEETVTGQSVGVRQSPIDINLLTVVPGSAPPLQWSPNYREIPNAASLINDGHSLRLVVNTNSPLTISGGELPTTYEFQQLHFHWGDNDAIGSEHTINNHSYPIEMHVVHSQSSNNGVDQFVVVGYFFRLSISDNPGLTNLLNQAIAAAQRPNEPIPVQPFRLSDLVKVSSFAYYNYEGSLTTPPYTESVNWIIDSTALPISPRQLKIFREAASLYSGLLNNFRRVQDLNGRTVRFIVPFGTK